MYIPEHAPNDHNVPQYGVFQNIVFQNAQHACFLEFVCILPQCSGTIYTFQLRMYWAFQNNLCIQMPSEHSGMFQMTCSRPYPVKSWNCIFQRNFLEIFIQSVLRVPGMLYTFHRLAHKFQNGLHVLERTACFIMVPNALSSTASCFRMFDTSQNVPGVPEWLSWT